MLCCLETAIAPEHSKNKAMHMRDRDVDLVKAQLPPVPHDQYLSSSIKPAVMFLIIGFDSFILIFLFFFCNWRNQVGYFSRFSSGLTCFF
jgi:hypothetical protein